MNAHVLSGKTVRLSVAKPDPLNLNGKQFIVIDWMIAMCDKIDTCEHRAPMCLEYAIRACNSPGISMKRGAVTGMLLPCKRLAIMHDSELVYPDGIEHEQCPVRVKITWEDEEKCLH